MSIERNYSFPEEPLRLIPDQPTPVTGCPMDKNGQLYFWDNVVNFPESFRKPNPQIRILPQLSLPKTLVPPEIKHEIPPSTNIDKQLHFWDKLAIPLNYIEDNQEFWHNVDRKRFAKTKPLPLKNISRVLHKHIVSTFNLSDAKEQDLFVSVLFDKPKSPTSKYVYEYRLPEDVKKEDRKDFFIGIERITEYSTNYITREFFRRQEKTAIGKLAISAFTELSDLLSYKILLAGTYMTMYQIEYIANQNGKDYKQAITDALFKHDFNPINELIADTKEMSGLSNINELAVHIGKKRLKKPDLSKWFTKLEIKKTDNETRATVKNCLLSVLAGGVYRNPGITEISAGAATFLILETVGVYLASMGANITSEEVIKLLGVNLATVITSVMGIYTFVPVHETFHGNSSNEEYLGLIPATLVADKKSPSMSSLEEADN